MVGGGCERRREILVKNKENYMASDPQVGRSWRYALRPGGVVDGVDDFGSKEPIMVNIQRFVRA